MKKLLFISAALLLIAAACNPITVDQTYDIDKVDPTVTLVPGITIAFEQEVPFEIGKLLEGATGEDSFLKAAPENDPLFKAGDLIFRQDGNLQNISPAIENIFEGTGPAQFENSMAVYMVDVPGMLNISNSYTLSNPCFKLALLSDLAHQMLMDVTISIAGTPLVVSDIPFAAKTSQSIYISAKGGYAKTADESDFVVPTLSGLISPLPYEIKITKIAFKKDPAVADPAYTPGTPVNLSVLASFILPADFTSPSSFSSSLELGGIKVTPNSDKYKIGISSISAHFEATNTLPLEIQIVGQPNDSISINFPTIAAGTIDNPVKTEGDIVLTYKSYSALSSLVTDITASAPDGKRAQLNTNQGITLAIKSVTIPDGVEIEFIKKEEAAQ